jgi:hypothetical protein
MRGWKKVAHRKRTKLERKRLPMKDVPLLVWTLNDKDIEYSTLHPFQVCNHYEGIAQLTTKRGFTELLKESMQWICEDQYDIAPRCYNLGDPLHREEFIEDFRITALANVLRWALGALLDADEYGHGDDFIDLNNGVITGMSSKSSSSSSSSDVQLPAATLKKWMLMMRTYLRVSIGGEWPGVELDGFSCREQDSPDGIAMQDMSNVSGTTDKDWGELLDFSYTLAETETDTTTSSSTTNNSNKFCYRKRRRGERECGACVDNLCPGCLSHRLKSESFLKGYSALPRPSSMLTLRLVLLLRAQALLVPSRQYGINGTRNVWIVKAPEASCGTGLRLHHRLGDILECERGFGGRSVQKYLEQPLLVPRVNGFVDAECSAVTASLFGLSTAAYGVKSMGATTTPYLPSQNHQNGGDGRTSSKQESKHNRDSSSSNKNNNSKQVKWHKFDVRVWVLVTSLEPLQAHIFSRVYGRQCGSAVSWGLGECQVSTLTDHVMHLTNYSVQKKVPVPPATATATATAAATAAAAAAAAAADPSVAQPGSNNNGSIPAAEVVPASKSASVKLLRGQVGQMRGLVDGGDGTTEGSVPDCAPPSTGPAEASSSAQTAQGSRSAYQETLLLAHEDVLAIINAHDPDCDPSATANGNGCGSGSSTRWDRQVWPALCRKVAAVLEATRCHPNLVHRNRSFELLGFDVIFDRNYQPWILEVNMSPAMAHRGTKQSSNIASMAEGLLNLAVLPQTDPKINPELYKAHNTGSYPYVPADHPGPSATTGTGATFDLSGHHPLLDSAGPISTLAADSSSNAFAAELARRTQGSSSSTSPSLSPLPETTSPRSPSTATAAIEGTWETLAAISQQPTPLPEGDDLTGPYSHLASHRKYTVGGHHEVKIKDSQRSSWKVIRDPQQQQQGTVQYNKRGVVIGQASTYGSLRSAPSLPNGNLAPNAKRIGNPVVGPEASHFITTHNAVMPHLRTTAGPGPSPAASNHHFVSAKGGGDRPQPPGAGRPKSAGVNRRPRSAYGANRGVAGGGEDDEAGLNIAFSLQGIAISPGGVCYVDSICSRFNQVLLLQRWGRRYLNRTRVWHASRHTGSLTLQNVALKFLYLCRRHHRRRHAAAISLQSSSRRRLAGNEAQRRRRNNAAINVQRTVRRRQAQERCLGLRQQRAATRLQSFSRGVYSRWRLAMAAMIVFGVRRWLLWRKRMKMRLHKAISGYYHLCQRRRGLAKKYILRWLYRKRARLAAAKLRCKRVGSQVAAAARARLLRLLETRQRDEERERANWNYAVELIATEALLSEPTSLSLVWAIAQSALEQVMFEYELEKRSERERRAAVEEEENARKAILLKVDANMDAKRYLRENTELGEQTRQLLCDARGVLQASDYRMIQQQLHDHRATKELNHPDVTRLKDGQAIHDAFELIGQFEDEQRKRRLMNKEQLQEANDAHAAAQEEKRESVIFNGRVIYAPLPNAKTASSKRGHRSHYNAHYAKATEQWQHAHTDEDEKHAAALQQHKAEYGPENAHSMPHTDVFRSPRDEQEAHSAVAEAQEHFKAATADEQEKELQRAAAEEAKPQPFTNQQLLERQREQQQRHLERKQRAVQLAEEKRRDQLPARPRSAASTRKGSASSNTSAAAVIYKQAAMGGNSVSKGGMPPLPPGQKRSGSATAAAADTRKARTARDASRCNNSTTNQSTGAGAGTGGDDASTISADDSATSWASGKLGMGGAGRLSTIASSEAGAAEDDATAASSVFGGSSAGVGGAGVGAGENVYMERSETSAAAAAVVSSTSGASSLLRLAHFSDTVVRPGNDWQDSNSSSSDSSTGLLSPYYAGKKGRQQKDQFTLLSPPASSSGSNAAVRRAPPPAAPVVATNNKHRNEKLPPSSSRAAAAARGRGRTSTASSTKSSQLGIRARSANDTRKPDPSTNHQPPPPQRAVGKQEQIVGGRVVGRGISSYDYDHSNNPMDGSGGDGVDRSLGFEEEEEARRLASAWSDQQREQNKPIYQPKRKSTRARSASASRRSGGGNGGGNINTEADSDHHFTDDLDYFGGGMGGGGAWDAGTFSVGTAFNNPKTPPATSSSSSRRGRGRGGRQGHGQAATGDGDYERATNKLLNSMLNNLQHY